MFLNLSEKKIDFYWFICQISVGGSRDPILLYSMSQLLWSTLDLVPRWKCNIFYYRKSGGGELSLSENLDNYWLPLNIVACHTKPNRLLVTHLTPPLARITKTWIFINMCTNHANALSSCRSYLKKLTIAKLWTSLVYPLPQPNTSLQVNGCIFQLCYWCLPGAVCAICPKWLQILYCTNELKHL